MWHTDDQRAVLILYRNGSRLQQNLPTDNNLMVRSLEVVREFEQFADDLGHLFDTACWT